MRAARLFAALFAVSPVALLGALSAACWEELPADADVCLRAKTRIATCGATVPLLDDGPCLGTKKVFSQCVADHAKTCTELATLVTRLDECMNDLLDGGDSLLPAPTDLPLPPRDASADATDAVARADASPIAPRDAGVDAPIAPVDAGASGPTTVTGLRVDDSVARDEELRYATPVLATGTYVIALTGNGDADLYVKKGAAPTTSSYDCRPFRATTAESCTVTLTAPSAIHVMVRGEATTSAFTLEGTP